MRRLPSVLALVLGTALPFLPPLSATTIQHFSPAELISGADLIVEGECLDTKPVWIQGTLVTSATFQVSARLKGNPPSQISIVLPGGIDLNRTIPVQVTFAGIPMLAPEEEMLLFLVPYSPIAGSYTILGMAQGKYSITEDVLSGLLARSNSTGMSLATSGAGKAPGSIHEVTLEQLRRQIATLLAEEEPSAASLSN